MAVLNKLKISKKTKSNQHEPTEQRLRRMLREKLMEQREMVEAELQGKQLVKTTTKYIPNKVTGELIQQEVPRQLRKWYWKEPDGTVCIHLLYGSIKLPINGENTTIEIKSLDELPKTIGVLMEAIDAGELDDALLAAMEERKKIMRGIKKA